MLLRIIKSKPFRTLLNVFTFGLPTVYLILFFHIVSRKQEVNPEPWNVLAEGFFGVFIGALWLGSYYLKSKIWRGDFGVVEDDSDD